ncbi:coiled-coil domain-containing protein 115 isoform X2 [Aricia agestis]|uniref:coiled-coil domain-containing protein 115 isoform X2 n=1 Tax=Aricia agestis TaxID=91739 RepID=UPI001C2026C6|nr:coiled-coil domain-containing protein 115 isoform X2 [Aricia agestis]
MGSCDLETTCDLLDKLTLTQLHLIEDKMRSELNLESSINNGSFHLAKSRYIMGQNSVSKEKLPTENTTEFSASVKTVGKQENNITQLEIVDQKYDTSQINPVHWFGVLVPQNLHKAKELFNNAINYVVEAVNIQLQILDNIKKIETLKAYKKSLV